MNNDKDDSEFRKTNESHKFYEKQLLLPTIYKINLSFGKKVIISFKEQKSSDLYPVVQLVGKDFIEVSFKADACYNFQRNFMLYQNIFTRKML